jgi:hypothetical protein
MTQQSSRPRRACDDSPEIEPTAPPRCSLSLPRRSLLEARPDDRACLAGVMTAHLDSLVAHDVAENRAH